MKKKLLVFHPVIAPYRIDFFNEFSKRFDAEICLYRRNLRSQKFDYAKIEELFNFIPNWIVKSELGMFRWLVQIWKKLSSRKNDFVVVSEFGLVTIVTILHKIITRGKYKIISVVDDSYNMVAENNQFSWKHKWATRVLMPFMNNVINVEPKVAEFYQQKYGKGVYMPIVVDDDKARDRLQRILPISQEYVKKYNLEEKKVLLFVGRLVGLKNIPFAIDAFLKADIKNSVFVIVGDGPEKLKEVIAELPKKDYRFNMEGGSWTNNISWVQGYENVLKPMEKISVLFNEKILQNNISSKDERYAKALFYLMCAQTSCFRYWGQGVWTDYAREICRRAEEYLR